MEKTLQNKVAFVTGAAFGIGRATAIAFASRGANVVIADWIEDDTTLNEIKKIGGAAIFLKCDVSKASDIERTLNESLNKFGKIDFAVNNAGIEGQNALTHECTEQNWDKTININLKGLWLCMKTELPIMLKQGSGAIVNVASVAGLIGFPGLPAYVVSKHGVVGLTKTAALEYAKQGIRINAVCPGVIKTEMVDRVTGKDKLVEKQFEDMEPVGRMGTPEEVAEAIVWLCSDAASFITGHALNVDGGWLAK
ncbi:SDR family oxidoreductase [Chryseolinea sp. H1M3-3]|uniref:SDR family oxidoreductase n=1 Tax=Chryseolinea sp. H1M3-3 TaxID=3034144 RepID=UPI0023ED4DDC|nr:SDR family oxidoreductase [Chryseolinea sp. H1M3-3]